MSKHSNQEKKVIIARIKALAITNMILAYTMIFVVVALTYIKGPAPGEYSAVAILIAAILNVRLLFVLPKIRTVSLGAYRLGITLIIPVIVILFAQVDWALSSAIPMSFTTPLTKIDALYFAVTTFTTTGYGDIAPHTELARLLVTVQMVLGLLILSVVVVRAVELFRRDT